MINGELLVDNFAGGGGASTGIEMATGCSVDIAINHDPEAIRMHMANHPYTKHYCESVWNVDPVKICNGHPVGLAWFSPDCKHYSRARGGKPRDKNIRGLAWIACRWAGTVRPRVIILENVTEFTTWGPLNRSHRPIKKKEGVTFKKFVSQLEALGYSVDCKELIAADYGTPTMRKRFFLIARCDGKSIIWPEPTHAPKNSREVAAGVKQPYVGAYTQIDFNRPCPSIFDTSEEIKAKYGIRAVRPLAENTMRRIARGIVRFILENPKPFIIQCNHGGKRRPDDIEEPLPTITSKHGYGIVLPILSPCCDNQQKIAVFIHKYYGGGYKGHGAAADGPLPTITAFDHNSIIATKLVREEAIGKHDREIYAFLMKYYGTGTGQSLELPIDTITSHDRFAVVQVEGVNYRIVDIGLRMLEPQELYGCQGFPADYIIDRDYHGKSYSRAEQVQRCGNAVCPPVAEALVRVNVPELCVSKRKPICRPDRLQEEAAGQLKFA